MKPNFALSLSFDGLRLMHRVPGGWHLVGQVALDDADLTGALARLRAAALTLEPDGLFTKLLIPNDQIRYLALDTTRADEDDVRAALDGATPYAVEDLHYDYAKGGGRTYVAAVARETLAEAEEFASEHGFNPVGFAAVPEPFTFVGEAFFGPTEGSGTERDDEPVVVIGTAAVTVPEPEATADAGDIPDTAPDAAPDDDADTQGSADDTAPDEDLNPDDDPTPPEVAAMADALGAPVQATDTEDNPANEPD